MVIKLAIKNGVGYGSVIDMINEAGYSIVNSYTDKATNDMIIWYTEAAREYNYEDIMYELICEYCKKDVSVKTFLEAVGDVFNLPTHKWSVFPNDNAPEGDVSEYTVWTNNGYEIFDITLNSYDNLGHAECIYETLKAELNF